MGSKLGILFARAGHDVVFSYARSEEKLQRLAREAGGNAPSGSPAEAVRHADAVLLAVHWLRMDDVLQQAGDLFAKGRRDLLAADEGDDSGLVIGHTTSGAEELAKKWARQDRFRIRHRAQGNVLRRVLCQTS